MAESHQLTNLQISAAAAAAKSLMANSEAEEDAVNVNINNINSSQKSREEGELSSNDEDDCHAVGSSPQVTSGQTAPPTPVTSGNAAPAADVQTAPTNNAAQNIKAGKSVSSNNAAGDVSSRTTIQSNCERSYEKNRGPFVPFLISFSDDDSGSDPEDSGQQTTSKDRNLGADRSKIPPVTSVPKLQKVQQTRSEATMLPRQGSLGHVFVSSMTQIHGASSKGSGLYPSSRASNTFEKDLQGHGSKTNYNLDTSKLQDLRQLIATRENELKRKLTQQTENSTSAAHINRSFNSPSNNKARTQRVASIDASGCEAKEPDTKRLKIGNPESVPMVPAECREGPEKQSVLSSEKTASENFDKSSRIIAAGHREVPRKQSVLSSEKSVSENFDKHKADDLSKAVSLKVAHSNFAASQKQGGSCGTPSSTSHPVGVKDGIDTVSKRGHIYRKPEVENQVTSSDQHAQTENGTAICNIRKASSEDLKHPAERSNRHASSTSQNNAASENYLTGRSDQHQIGNVMALEPTAIDRYQGSSPRLLNSNTRINDVSFNNSSFWSGVRTGNSDVDMQALLDHEESHDKDLEEAQEHRQKCEVEERKALIAYRKAQRALAEANARCSYLYRKREIYSAQLRAVMMENPNLFWPLGAINQFEPQLTLSNNFSNINAHLVTTSSGQVQAEYDACNPHTSNPNVHSLNVVHQSLQALHVSGQNTASDRSSEPDGSTSDPHNEDGVANGVLCLSDNSSMSEDENGETYHVTENGLENERKEESSADSEKEIKNGSDRVDHLDNSQDSLLLEASLRSQLFERLRLNAFTKKRSTDQVEPLHEGTANDDGGEKEDLSSGKMPPSGGDETKLCDLPDSSTVSTDLQQPNLVTLLCPVLRSVFRHLKISEPTSLVQSQIRSPETQVVDIADESGDGNLHVRYQPANSSWTLAEAILMDEGTGQIGCYSSNIAIDPIWPLCMYELRGKCNNDECAWQHVKNYSCNADFQVASSNFEIANYLVLTPPKYLVDLDVLQANPWPCKSNLAGRYGLCWRKCFSTSLVLSSLLPADFSSSEPFLHGSEPRIEPCASWNRQLFYFHSQNGTVKQADQCPTDRDQALEMALLNLSYEANKQKGRLKALKVLARAVEADPTSAVLWIVYLQIYYSNQKSVGKDDLFQYAVEHNENSYEIWLLYINSRKQLDDHLAAYDAALLALCRHASSTCANAKHASKCILDIFLQMINSLCMSGNVGKALEIINGLVPSIKSPDKLPHLFLPDVITCLTIYDKCVFWVSCVYLAIYRKLPDAIVQQFEFEKELYAIEWPDTHLTSEGKRQANLLMGIAVDSLTLHIDGEPLENEEALRAAHLFAINHVSSVAVLEGIECSRNLLAKYTKLYPSCLELVLMSAWVEHEFGSEKFAGFEMAVSNWLDDIPGVQCLWNQYAACVLQSGRYDFANELMDRWLHSVWKGQYSQSGNVDSKVDEAVWNMLQSASASDPFTWYSISGHTDVMFGLLNFSIYSVLRNDHTKARLALDKALKAATDETYSHCVREHALLSFAGSLQQNSTACIENIMKSLNGYLVDARASQGSEPLSRFYIQKIKKPRVQQIVSKLLNPVSNFSLANSVLEAWYGPSLIPQAYDKPSELVDFVEAVMGILPSNYQLAISVCKLLIQSSKTAKEPANVSFWASSLLVNALFQAVPVAPESIWLESADILRNVTDLQAVSESFHRKALSVYPFSIKLWKSYLSLFSYTSNESAVREAATEKGIVLD